MDPMRLTEVSLEARPTANPHNSGQIITTSAEVTLNGGLVRESPQHPLNSGLGIILICPDNFGPPSPSDRKKQVDAF